MLLRLSSKGQLVLPKKIREKLHLKNGDQFQARIEDGKIVLEPVKMDVVARLHGILAGTDVLKELEEEHRREIEHDRDLSA
ncbi:MAG: AbrB/MazE/SpoVT family DNA-binding domain-containing protein [Chloroflexota bacterium]